MVDRAAAAGAEVNPDEKAELLLLHALTLADDIRDDLAAAHRALRSMDRIDLEGLACVLAALVPPDIPVDQLAWWRVVHVAPSRREPEVCGTRAGYRRHSRNGQQPCEPCVTANRTYESERKAAQRARLREDAA